MLYMKTLVCVKMVGNDDCKTNIKMIDNKGFIYCENCGNIRKQYRSCRKLTKTELKDLNEGKSISYKRK